MREIKTLRKQITSEYPEGFIVCTFPLFDTSDITQAKSKVLKFTVQWKKLELNLGRLKNVILEIVRMKSEMNRF